MASARHRAHSLLEGSRAPVSSSCTVICSPAFSGITPSEDSASIWAAWEMVTGCSGASCPAEMASMAIRHVISLEVLAIGYGASA